MTDLDVFRFVERAPMRTVRWEHLTAELANPARTLARLAGRGALTRIARGVYVAPPGGADGRTWKPPLETAALALGTARFGERRVILTGVGAARFWHAIPRAIAETRLAVPVPGRHPVRLDTGGVVRLAHRDLDRIDATLEPTELGDALVATPAQTLYDLLGNADRGVLAGEIAGAIATLRARVAKKDLVRIAGRAERVPAAVTGMLGEWSDDG